MTRATATDIRRSTSAEAVEQSQTETLCRHAHIIAAAAGISLSRPKVSRLVRRYEAQVSHNGWAFWDYVANCLLLTAEQRAQVVVDPELSRVISYLDNTGEDAVRHVMRERGY
jgi:hypothetical protein